MYAEAIGTDFSAASSCEGLRMGDAHVVRSDKHTELTHHILDPRKHRLTDAPFVCARLRLVKQAAGGLTPRFVAVWVPFRKFQDLC